MVNCFFCGKEDAINKCVKCKKAWFCNKECQKKGWKEHKSKCSELYNSVEEENNFNIAINNLKKSYDNRFSLAIKSYRNAYFKLENVFNIQVDYLYLNIKNNKYIEILHDTLIYLKDAETDWRLLQSHAAKMKNFYEKNKNTEWDMVLDAFYDQLFEETTNNRILVYLGLMHCYYFISIEITDNEKSRKNYENYYNAYYDLICLYKSKLKDEKYIANIKQGLQNIEKFIKQFKLKTSYI